MYTCNTVGSDIKSVIMYVTVVPSIIIKGVHMHSFFFIKDGSCVSIISNFMIIYGVTCDMQEGQIQRKGPYVSVF